MAISSIPPRGGVPLSELIDEGTRQQLEALRDKLGQPPAIPAAPLDRLVKDSPTLQRIRDVTAAVGQRSLGWLLDKAPRTPLLSMLAGKGFGPQQATLLATTPIMGLGGAIQATDRADVIEADFEVLQPSLQLEAPEAQVASKPSWWQSIKDFGSAVMDKAGIGKVWANLKNHRLVAPIMGLFTGKGFGPAHGAVYGANPPSQPTPGAPLQALLTTEAPWSDPNQDLRSATENLSALWPPELRAPPAPFERQAAALQSFKTQSLTRIGAQPSVADLSALLRQCDAIHQKPGHSHNVTRLAQGFLSDRKVSQALRGADFSPRQSEQIRSAAAWVSLGDIETDVALLSGPLAMTPKQNQDQGQAGARLFQDLGLGGTSTATLLADARGNGERALEAQLLRLIDESAGVVGQGRGGLSKHLYDQAATGAFDPALVELMLDADKRGVVNQALS